MPCQMCARSLARPSLRGRLTSRAGQTGDGITHPAEFLFELLRGLNITSDTLKDLLVRELFMLSRRSAHPPTLR